MGLDMYLERRSSRVTDEQINMDYEHKRAKEAHERFVVDLETLKNAKTVAQKHAYVENRYKKLLDDREKQLAGANPTFMDERLFCGGGWYTSSRPQLFLTEEMHDMDNKDIKEYDYKITDFTIEELANMICENDTKLLTTWIEQTKEEMEKNSPIPEELQEFAETQEVGYWRKANAIHGWFIENGFNQEGDYFCELDIKTLKELNSICLSVLGIQDEDYSSEVLPTCGGFFFGQYEYNEWYYDDVKDTIKILEEVIATHQEGDRYVYIASY